jgi:hypothetical protein
MNSPSLTLFESRLLSQMTAAQDALATAIATQTAAIENGLEGAKSTLSQNNATFAAAFATIHEALETSIAEVQVQARDDRTSIEDAFLKLTERINLHHSEMLSALASKLDTAAETSVAHIAEATADFGKKLHGVAKEMMDAFSEQSVTAKLLDLPSKNEPSDDGIVRFEKLVAEMKQVISAAQIDLHAKMSDTTRWQFRLTPMRMVAATVLVVLCLGAAATGIMYGRGAFDQDAQWKGYLFQEHGKALQACYEQSGKMNAPVECKIPVARAAAK